MDASFNNTYNYFDISALSQLKGNGEDKKDETIKVVAQQLESVFLELVLKTMNEANSSIKSDIFDRDNEEFYQDMFNQQLSLSLSKSGGIGLADVIVKQLRKHAENILPVDQTRVAELIQKGNQQPNRLPESDSLQNGEKRVIEPVLQFNPTEINEPISNPDVSSSRLESIKEFIETLLPYAEKAASVIGIDPKLLLAQSALETGWGKHIIEHKDGISSHNLFGVKSHGKWSGESVNAKTLEYENNESEVIEASFKSYKSYMDSFVDYINILKSKRYEKALDNVEDPKSFLTELHQAGYATDPNYVDKILTIYKKFM